MFQKPTVKFDVTKIKVNVNCKKTGTTTEVILEREWAKKAIPHFSKVINGVPQTEGIEITLACSPEAFCFAIDYLKTAELDADKCEVLIVKQATQANCLSLLVLCDFL